MRRIGSILLGLVLIATSCTQALDLDFSSAQGELKIKLKQDSGTTSTKTSEDEFPDTGEFIVEVTETSSGRTFYRKKYADLADQTMHLNEGEHKCYAFYGDPKGVGFSAYYYTAEAFADIRQNQVADVEMAAKLTNVKVAVNFGPALAFDHKDYYAQVTTQTGRKLTFTKSESRCGYVPVGDITLTLYIYVNDQWLCYSSEPVTCVSNDFVTFNLDTHRTVNLTSIEVIVDNGTEEVVKEFEVPAAAAPKDAPAVSMNGFAENTFSVVEATDQSHSGFKADIVAMGGVQNCFLNINSAILSAAGIPSELDLAALTPEQEKALAAFGIKYLPQMSGKRFAYVDFSGLVDYISSNVSYNPDQHIAAEFSIEVIDTYGKAAATEIYSVSVEKAEATIIYNDYDVWATKMVNPVITVTKGDPSRFVLKCVKASDMMYTSTQTISPKSVSGKTVKFDGFTGLSAGTTYKVWAQYNNNGYSKTPEIQFTTEKDQQVGNNGFESFVTNTFSGTHTTYWYDLWESGESDHWWATNSSATLDKSNTAAYGTYKSFPTVNITSKNPYAGQHSVVVASIAVGDASSEWNLLNSWGDAVPGEVFIGEADNSGEHKGGHTKDGHAFNSRPASMSFMHKLESYESDPYYVEIKILDADGEVIASAKKTDGATTVSSWTKVTLPLIYETTTKKASSIYILFKSSATGKTKSRKYSLSRYEASSEKSSNVHAGNLLWIDDVKLNY